MFKKYDLEGLLKIFQISKKKDLTKHCKSLVVHRTDFANVIVAAEAGLLGYLHQIHYRDFVDEELHPQREDFDAIGANGLGPLKGDAVKAINKIQQLFSTRRYLVGHIFYTNDLRYWHFFYFDQRDTSPHYNHWKEGSHIHLINHLWPDRSAESVWAEFTTGNPKMKGSLHIRFVEHRKSKNGRI